MSFEYLTEAQMLLIKDHYIDRQGTFDTFYLSAADLGRSCNAASAADQRLYLALFISEVVITDDVSFDRFTVEVELETIPIELGDLIFDAQQARQ
jgi:hypothetical protein